MLLLTSSTLFRSGILAIALIFTVFTMGYLLGSLPAGSAPVDGRDVLYQVSTIDALLQGVYDGTASIETLARHGDFGLGCFDALDGEMLALDGVYYQLPVDGRVRVPPPDATVPFAAVTFFDPDMIVPLRSGMNLTGLEAAVDAAIPSKNYFSAVRVDGTFASVTVRSVPRQEKPYPPLTEVVAEEPVIFILENVSGTAVGFRSPAFTAGVNVPGYHLHFITDDRTAGGHILDLRIEEGTAAVDSTAAFFLELPSGEDFAGADLTLDQQEALKKVER
ncbi:acetolactate decarboxylase [Methanoculleus taiwanensis]|nr:acetolactate decarboxylase [Methanoculleus taiwanensis]